MTLTREEWAEIEALEKWLENEERSTVSPIARYCPTPPHPVQERFLAIDALEALYGGQVAGGKSSCLLMGALQHVDVPGYAALVLRRTYADLKLPGALMDRAREWFSETDAQWEGSSNTWQFPKGGSISFGYLETEADIYRYQSAEFQYIAFDELTQFSQRQYTYLLSRLRRPKEAAAELGSVPLRMRAATNPGGVGHRWVMERFAIKQDGTQELGHKRPFIAARLEDNPGVDASSYDTALSELDQTTRDQLRKGLWIPDGQGRIYPYDPERHGIAELPEFTGRVRKILVIDLGSSEATPTTAFAVIVWDEHDPNTYVAQCFKVAGLDVTGCAEIAKKLIGEHGGVDRIVMDVGGLGEGYAREFRSRHHLLVEAAEKRHKLAYRKLKRGALERGTIKVVRSLCAELEQEYEDLLWDDKGLDAKPGLADHCSDAVLYGWRYSRAHVSRAPAKSPAPGTPEWDRAEAERIRKAEIRRYEERQARPDVERW